MVQRHERRHIPSQKSVHKAVIEGQSFGVDFSGPPGQHAGPAHRKAVAVQAQVLHQVQIAFPAVVVIAGHITVVGVFNGARLAGEGVPDGQSFAVLVGCPFDLVAGGGRTPAELGRKLISRQGHE